MYMNNILIHKYHQGGLKYDVDADGMHPNIVKAIRERPSPMDVAEPRRASGMINYLRSYIPDLSTILQPLNKLLRFNVT